MAVVDLKVVMLGKEFCGKTSLVERYLNNRFAGENRYQNTIGAAFGAREVEAGGRRVMVGVWDTAGSERYEAMTRMYYRGARAAILCYAVTDEESWERLQFWVNELQAIEEKCRLYVAATKLDLVDGHRSRQVDYHNTTDFCETIGAKLFETSSKENKGIEELFATIAEDYVADGKRDPSILVEGETRIGGRSTSGGKLQGGKKKPCCASS